MVGSVWCFLGLSEIFSLRYFLFLLQPVTIVVIVAGIAVVVVVCSFISDTVAKYCLQFAGKYCLMQIVLTFVFSFLYFVFSFPFSVFRFLLFWRQCHRDAWIHFPLLLFLVCLKQNLKAFFFFDKTNTNISHPFFVLFWFVLT